MEVRTRHNTATRKARKVGFGPISQLDMVLTQFGFMGFGLLAPEKLGVSGSPEEQEGFIHFWRTVGHLLGIEDRSGISVNACNSSSTWVYKILMAKGNTCYCGLVRVSQWKYNNKWYT